MKDYELGIEAVLIHQLFEAQVAQLPDAVAVDFEGEQLTYQDLNYRANQLAHHLQALGVGPDVLVGICMERSLLMIVALLGILKAGGAYVPLDPTYPKERLTFMLENAQAPILLTQSDLVGNWQKQGTSVILDTDWQAIAFHSTANPNSSVTPDDLAYVIYTSGSTGKPKGVAMPHRPLVNLIAWQLENSVVAAGAKTLQFTPISFDVSFQEIFATLAAGGTLVLISDETRRDPVRLLRFLHEAAIERLFLPFVALRQLAEVAEIEGVVPTHLKEVITAGEQLRITSAISHWFSQLPNCTLHNHYGPSESHVVTAFTLTGSPNEWSVLPPIGRPIANSQIYLLDSQLQPVPVGVAGELYIGGVSLARGYLNRPDLTAERFIANPFSPQLRHLYKTGDLARYLPDGNIEYLGRIDQQVKIRGFRIEPGEIEAALEQYPLVREGVVIAREDVPGDKRLVAYVVSSLVPDRIPYQSDCLAELDGKAMKLHTKDISDNGVCLVGVPPTFSKGKDIRLRLRLPIEREERWLKGIVAWCEGQQAGIEFQLVPSEQELVHQSVEYLLETQGLLNILQRTVTGNLRDYLKQKLPDYMIPSVFIVLKALPLTPSGKVDRRALPAPTSRPDLENLTAPRTPTETRLAGIWADILGLKQVGIHDHFLELGGHSLLATQVVSRIRDVFQVELPLRCLFESPTVSELAKYLETAQQKAREQTPSIQPAPSDAKKPLSFVQEQLWFLDQLVPNNPFYNVPEAFRLNGSLNVTALQQGFQEIILRHEALRTTFTIVDGEPVQVIHPSPSFTLSVVDLHELPTVERETQAWQLIAKEAQHPFNLSQGPLLLCTLFKLSETEHILLLNLHHIICDDWSISVLLQELATLYTAFSSGHSSPLPALTIQYADFAVWQRQWLTGDIRESQLSYWKQQLSDRLPVLQLPTDYSRPLVRTYRGARQFLTITEPLTEKLKNLSRSEGVTLFMTLLAAFQTLLFHYTRQEDIVVGSPIANRHRSEIEGVFGFFLNTLVLRTDLSGSPSFRQLLVRVREVALGAYAHQDLPFEQLVQALQPDRNLNQNPLFQVLFDLQNTPMPAWEVPDLTLTRLSGIDNRTAKFDLFLELAETKTGITGFFEYSTDLFEAATIARMIGHFQTLLEGIVTNPDQRISDLSLLSATEQQQLVAWNDTQIDYPQVQCIHQLFEATAERTPETVAVVFADQQLTYRELNHRANQLAHHLQALGVKPDVSVGLCVERSLATVIGLLGILKAGGAYVPLDPAYPQERLAFMLEDSLVPVLLTQQHLIGVLPNHRAHVVCLDTDWDTIAIGSSENPNSPVRLENLAYTIYTSGSTGKPKGVQIEHRAVVNFLNSMRQEPGLTETDVLLAVTTISFDIAALEIYLPLIVGARTVLVSREVASNAPRLSKILEQSGATVMQATPATWRLLLAAGWQGNKQLKILCGGEALTRQLANQLLEKSNSLWNMYGPTETTIWSAIHKVEPGNSPVPIGRPIANTQIYLRDQHLRRKGDPFKPVPIGVPGELIIGGVGLARGYLNRPELTDEKFIPNPFSNEPGARLYKTGDLARYLSDGNIEIIGRIDHQVKIRGFRIELGEIEAAISQHPAVRETVVIAREDKSDDKRLVAYVVPQPQPPESGQHTIQASDAEPTLQWQKIWNETYSQSSTNQDPTFNISGWNNSYTGVLTPDAELREWLDHTVERILSLQPNRVLEIGCGLGLLLFRIAPKCEHYFGTDISKEAVDYIEQQLNSNEQNWSQVTLCQRAADAFEGVETSAFDTVVINSVIQYFPSIDYLVRVLEGAVKAVKPGGCIFVGDVRSLPLLEAFHTSVQRYQAPDSLPKAQLHKRVQERIAQDKELVIDPAFFTALAQHLPQISHVQIQLKRGSHHNELTRFRYDVILHVGTEDYPTVDPLWLDWQQQELTLPAIRQLLSETEPEILGISRVLNARVLADTKAVELLASDNCPETAGELRQTLEEITQGVGIDPEDLWNLSQDLPYTIHINWSGSGADGCYDVVFQRRSKVLSPDTLRSEGRGDLLFPPTRVLVPFPERTFNLKPWSSYANDPVHVKATSNLVPQLRAFLNEKLPDYMVPSAFVVMDTLPLMPNGKIDRRALPEPNRARPDLKEAFVASRTPIEERLAQIWAAVLGIEQVGIHDNFFELGGHSLLTIQMLSAVQKTFQVELPLLSLFKAPTVAGLAQMIADQQAEASAPSPINPVVDLNAEAVLDPAINPLVASIEVVSEPANIFLTGATGFLGAFLLHELLEQTQASIYCLVKATYPTEARDRLQGSLESYSLWNQSKSKRIIPVVGDLALPLLGLSSEQFQTLAETIDVIYHNGGSVNFIYPYSVLKAPNVLGTQEVLRLASRTKVKPVHFVSTVGVFSPVAYPEVQVIQEQEADRPEGLYGYTQSKWVAEKLLAIARQRGLPTSIYRPTWIEGHSQTGVGNRPGFLRSLIKGCIQLGLAPDWNMQVDIVPVDYTASAIVHLSRQTSSGKAFHVSNPKSISWNQLVNWMREFGYPIQLVPYSKWIAEVMHLVQTPENALYSFLSFLSEHIPEQQKTVPEIYFQAKSSLRFDCQNTLDGLVGTAITCPPVDDKLLTTYFSYFIRSGFLEPPQIKSESVFEKPVKRFAQGVGSRE